MIKVLIVDDIPETRDHLSRLLGLEREIDVAGTAGSGEEAIQVAMDMRPDVIVMDINMPGMDGIAAAEIISQRLPHSPIIMMSVHGEAEHLKRSMLAGAREFLVKPFSGDEFATSIKRVHERELARREQMQTTAVPATTATDDGGADQHQVIAVFSPKGGSGKTTLAVNLALALKRETNQRVALVDANLQFGDVGVLLNLNPKNRSVVDAVGGGEPDRDIVESVMVDHSTGIRVLLAPPSPEGADLVTAAYLRKMIAYLRDTHDWVVVDLPSGLNDHTLGVLDAADQILVVAALEITTIKNVRLFLEVADQLDYERSKMRLVINRSDASQGIRISDVEASIRRSIDGTIVSDGRLAVLAVNRGVPFVVSHPESPLSRDVIQLARTLAGEGAATTDKTDKAAKRGLFARR
ncbi:MAG: pilus assembly protein CpaE [Chloroflexota bacterium]|jgi:pilus assembly protein CpaE|nr:pilus assembly protein CpaE [Chloroflexota bacterium]